MPASSPPPSENPDSVSRRDFLRVGGLGVVGLSMAESRAAAETSSRRNCIFLLMTGGASQLETFDPKPEAPSHIRGPMKAIATAVPGTALSESLPRLAERADRFALIRSLHHTATAIHETGYQLLQTGHLAHGDWRPPAFGSVIARELGPRGTAPPYVVIPRLLSQTGVNMFRGQTAGSLGADYDPCVANGEGTSPAGAFEGFRFPRPEEEPDALQRRYGRTRFGTLCLQARQLLEAGVRCVVVNLFDRLDEGPTWDCHGKTVTVGGTLFDYRDVLCPWFDRAVAALLDDLRDRGLLNETLLVAAGEFGRTPRINAHGGRDHWPGVWSALIAGGGVTGGAVLGASDAHAAEPKDRPTSPTELLATIYRSLQVEPFDGETDTLAEQPSTRHTHQPLTELFA